MWENIFVCVYEYICIYIFIYFFMIFLELLTGFCPTGPTMDVSWQAGIQEVVQSLRLGISACLSVYIKISEKVSSNANQEWLSSRTDKLASKTERQGQKQKLLPSMVVSCRLPPKGVAQILGGFFPFKWYNEESPPDVPSRLSVSWLQKQSSWQGLVIQPQRQSLGWLLLSLL